MGNRLEIPDLPVNIVAVTSTALALRSELARLLQSWSADDVEEAAWEFALVGWQQSSALGEDYDRAFSAYLQLLLAAVNPGPGSAHFALESVRHLLEELRNRVQFIQTRAGDIRLSHQFSRLLEVTGERIVDLTNSHLEELAVSSEEERSAIVSTFSERHGSLFRAFADGLGRYSGAAGATAHFGADVAEQLRSAIKELERLGVMGNVVYDALKYIVSHAAPHV